MNNLIRQIKEAKDQKENFVLATILEKSGSAPRNEGAKMMIREDLSIEGSIGGGLVEAMVIRTAARVIKDNSYQI